MDGLLRPTSAAYRHTRWVDDIRYCVLAYRELTDDEVLREIKMWLLDEGGRPKPGTAVTIGTSIGL